MPNGDFAGEYTGGGFDWGKLFSGVLGGIGGGIAGGSSTPTSMTGSGSSTTNGQSETNTNASSNNSFQQFLQSLMQGNTTTAGTSSTTPNLSASNQALIDQLTGRFSQLATPSLNGYQASQTQGINRNADLQSQSVANIMASRGLAMSPAAATAQGGVEQQRFTQLNQMQQNLPLLKNQMDLTNYNAAGQFAASIPHGTTTTTGGTTDTSQTQGQTSGGQNFANQWGYQGTNSAQHTDQASAQQQKSGGGIGAAVGGIATMLASLFSDKNLKENIKEIPSEKAVNRIMALKPVTWKWKGSDYEDTGLLAQDLQKVMPELVHKDPEGSGFLKVNYAGLISELVGAVQAIATVQQVGA